MKKIKLLTIVVLLAFTLTAQNQIDTNEFLQVQIAKLNEIQPLDVQQTQKIDSAFRAEWQKYQNEQIAFNYAMSITLTNENYFSRYFKGEIEKRAWIIYQDDLSYYRNAVKLSQNVLNDIKPLLKKRSDETSLCEFIYFADAKKRYKEIGKIRENYREQLSSVTLKNKSKGATYNLGLVLENREQLNLAELQIDSVVAAVQQIRELTNNGIITKEKNNRWEYERQFILKILNEEQVSDFVTIRNYDYAKSFAEKQWRDMQKNNIAFEYDSVKTVQEIIAYQLKKEKLKYVYKENPEKFKELDDYLYKTSYPKSLKHLRVEKRKRTSQEATEKDELIF